MTRQRFYCRPIKTGRLTLTDDEARHAVRVRRLSVGDHIELFDGAGCCATARIEDTPARSLTVSVTDVNQTPPRSHRHLIIAPSIPKGDRFDWLISKCTELDVDRICPVLFQRTVKQASGPRAHQRCQKLALAAAKQSRRLFLPQIDPPAPLPAVLQTLTKDYPQAVLLTGLPDPAAPSALHLETGPAPVIALVGPEGGFTPEEHQLLLDHHARPVRLTETILRVETAAVAFAALLAACRAAQSPPP